MVTMSYLAFIILVQWCTSYPVEKKQFYESSPTSFVLKSLARDRNGRVTRTNRGQQTSHNNKFDPSCDCSKLFDAWKKTQDAVRNGPIGRRLENKIQMMSLRGMVFPDDTMISDTLCALAGIESLEQLAAFLHYDEFTLKEKYSDMIATLDTYRQAWRRAINSAFIMPQDRRVFQAVTVFLDELENTGLFALT